MGIFETLGGGAMWRVASYAGMSAREFLKLSLSGRALVLLHRRFGPEADVDRSAFLSWQSHSTLMELFEKSLTGISLSLPEQEELRDRIAARLVRTPDGLRSDLAWRIADELSAIAPLIVDDRAEQTSYLSNKSSSETREILEQLQGLTRRQIETEGSVDANIALALVAEPLDHADARELADEASRLEDEHPAKAAELLVRVCEKLDSRGLHSLAEVFRARAARLFAEAGRHADSADAFEVAARGQISRGSSMAFSTVSAFSRLASDSDQWRAEALDQRVHWIGDSDAALGALRNAVVASDRDRLWLAELADLLVLDDRWDEILELTDGQDPQWTSPESLRLSLARAEGLSALQHDAARDFWDNLTDGTREERPQDEGLVWQRRAIRLAYDDHPRQAAAAYREAMTRWRSFRGYEEQLADCFYSALNTAMHASLSATGEAWMPLAAELRGPLSNPAARADQLEVRAMSHHLQERFREAIFVYGNALWIHRLAGSMTGVLTTLERIAMLFERSGRHVAAFDLFIKAGNGKKAREQLEELESSEAEASLALEGPGWHRTASYLAMARIGTELSEGFVEQHIDRIIDDAESDLPERLGPHPRWTAREALGAIAPQTPHRVHGTVREILESEFESGLPAAREAAGRGLALGTDAGHWDHRLQLVSGFLESERFSGVDTSWIANACDNSDDAAKVLEAEAIDGNRTALLVFAMTDRATSPDPAVSTHADEALGARETLKAVERKPGSVTVSGHHLEDLGLLMLLASSDTVAASLRKLLDVIHDQEEPENNRASALGAIYNARQALTSDQLHTVVDVCQPLALGQYEASPWDENETDPLAALRIDLHTANALRGLALQLAALAREDLNLDEPDLNPAIWLALSSDDTTLRVAALQTLSVVRDLQFVPAALELLASDDVAIRAAAAGSLAELGQVDEALVEKIASDQSTRVRQQLRFVDQPAESRNAAWEALRVDRDARVRIFAARRQDR